jgi:tetratricopeptide repeat protein 8
MYDSSNVEAIACLASFQFYSENPELALRYYRRLLQMGIANTELWNNLGLCCFYAQQYDTTLRCFEKALSMAEDENMADVWYNIGMVAVGLGDVGLANQAFKIAASIDTKHAESFNNMGVLELRKGNIDQARSNLQAASQLAPMMWESRLNEATILHKNGEFEECYRLASDALKLSPSLPHAQELVTMLKNQFSS